MEILKPDKEALKTLDEIMVQNRKILEFNMKIAEMVINPPLVLSGDERDGIRFKVPKAQEVIS